MESIESQPAADATTEYLVPAWVRVRREDFGLLFFDTRSTRLTFVRSGESFTPPPFTGARRVLQCNVDEVRRSPALQRLLDDLKAKGLIVVAETE